MLLIRLNHFSRIAGNDNIIWDVVRHNASGTHYDTVADRYTGTDYHTASKPTILADVDRQTGLNRFTALHVIMRMIRCQQLTVRTNQRVRTDSDASSVQKHTIEIDEHPFTHRDPVSVVTAERRTNNHRRMCVR